MQNVRWQVCKLFKLKPWAAHVPLIFCAFHPPYVTQSLQIWFCKNTKCALTQHCIVLLWAASVKVKGFVYCTVCTILTKKGSDPESTSNVTPVLGWMGTFPLNYKKTTNQVLWVIEIDWDLWVS